MTIRPLFGGAVVAHVPDDYIDARPVPDNQEVFFGRDGLSSLIFDINELVGREQAHDDAAAVAYHFHDMLPEGDEQNSTVECQQPVTLPHLPGVSAYQLDASIEPGKGQDGRANVIRTSMVLIRLEQRLTDIVITMNDHIGRLDRPDVAQLVAAANERQARVLQTFEIKDWSLFGSG